MPQDLLDRNPPRFAKLVGQHIFQGFKDEGPQYTKVNFRPEGLYE